MNYYWISDMETGKPVCCGDKDECAEALGMESGDVFARNIRSMAQYRVVCTKKSEDSALRAAAEKWDRFAAAAREKYNVPVYRGED